jgi:hypothetical protein
MDIIYEQNKEAYHLEYTAQRSVEIEPPFWKNISPQFHSSKNKLTKKPARNRK